MILHASVRVVSAKDVVRLHCAIVAVPFALKRVQEGLQVPSSVSIRKFRFCVGVPAFLIASLKVVIAIPLPNIGKNIRVFAVTSDTFNTVVADANVEYPSANTLSHNASDSHA